MPPASRVLLAPPEAWPEEKLLAAARALPPRAPALRPGDEVAGLVVLGVEPAPGAEPDEATTFEIQGAPRFAHAPIVDLAVLLDVGESMELPWSAELTRGEAAREALSSFLRRGGQGVGDVTVLAYGKDAKVVAGPRPLRDMSSFDVPPNRGAARTAHALDVALTTLARAAHPERCQSILLLTDGAGDADLAATGARAGRLGVPVHILVFAPEVDPILDELARASGGSVQRAMLPLVIDFVHEPHLEAPPS